MYDFDPSAVRVPNGHFIDGRLVPGSGNTIAVRRPTDNAVCADLPLADADTVDEAVQNAAHAYATTDWSTGAPRSRARLLRRWADLIEANRVALGQLEALSSTRPVKDAIEIDIPYAADCIRFFAEFADKLGGEIAATRADHLGMVTSEPYGVVAAISPWNFPITQAITKIAPALAAGNAVVLKPSEMTPFSALALAELAIEAGIPRGIFNIVQGTGAVTGDLLCRHPAIGKISFTGSTRTGEAIMTASAQSGIKPVTLELGGKSPQLVFADVPDIDRVAHAVAGSILNNAGQVCVAGSRLIVQRSVEVQLLERIIDLTKAIRPGPTWASATTYSPVISHPQMARIDGIVKRAIAGGAGALIGGAPLSTGEEGAYYQPTILSGLEAGAEAIREEIFGPVLTVQSFEDEEEGLALTDHEYGLAAGVYTGDINRALRARRRIQAGTIWVNRYGRSADFIVPTGGFNHSGIGKDLGRQAVEANLRHKSTLIAFDA